VNDHQRRVLGRVADEIAAYRAGSQSLDALLNRVWGLFTAAELPPGEGSDQFIALYDAVSSADDALRLHEIAPSFDASEEALDVALSGLEAWAVAVRYAGDTPAC
jgi:hypothetical protein